HHLRPPPALLGVWCRAGPVPGVSPDRARAALADAGPPPGGAWDRPDHRQARPHPEPPAAARLGDAAALKAALPSHRAAAAIPARGPRRWARRPRDGGADRHADRGLWRGADPSAGLSDAVVGTPVNRGRGVRRGIRW